MKNLLTLLFLVSLFIFTGCKKEAGNEKRKQLEDLKKQQEELQSKIAKLEKDLALTDPSGEPKKEKDVTVQPIAPTTFTHYVEVNGSVTSDKNITISARAAGPVTKVIGIRGQKVHKGQVLATIDASLTARGIEELKSSMSLLNTIYEKQKKLWDQQIGTEVQYLQAKNNRDNMERKLNTMQEQYDQSLIKSTIDGIVDEVFIKEGETVAPGAQAFRVVSGTDYKVTAEVPESYLSKVFVGNDAEVALPDLNDTLQVKISNVSDVISASNRTFIVKVDLPGKQKDLKANMLAYLRIKDYSKSSSIVVPINIIQHNDQGGDYVFVAEGNMAKRKNVKVGHTYKSNAEILSGLQPGDKIVTVGYLDMVEGLRIKY